MAGVARLVLAVLLCHAGTLSLIAASDVLLPGRLIPYGGPPDFGIGDFDGDGRVDILVATSDPDNPTFLSGLSLLHGNGDGTFDPRHITYDAPASPVLVVSDLNDDGRLDAILSGQTYVGGQTRGTVSVSLGKGDGTFMPQNVTAIGPVSPSFIESGDFNGDGVKDLIALSEIQNDRSHFSMWTLLGKGDGSFLPPTQTLSAGGVTSAGFLSNQVAVADYNGDGLDDLAVTETYLGISLFLSNGDGTFGYQGDVATPLVPVFVRTADLNLDGHPDLITSDLGSMVDVYVLFGRGDGTFGAPVGYDTGPSSNTFYVTDLNGDGAPDISVAQPDDDLIVILLNDGHGEFSIAGTHVVGHFPLTFGAADFNRDGRIDLAVGTIDEGQLMIGSYPAGTKKICLLLGTGGGAFDSASLHRTGLPFPSPPSYGAPTLAAGDLNGDGRIDLLKANFPTNNVSAFLGNPDGTFGAERTFSTGQGPGSIAAGDYDGDRALDVVTGNSGSLDLSVHHGRGDGTFAAAMDVPLGYALTSLASADFNQDGRSDLVVASPARTDIAILLGQADGTFSTPIYFGDYLFPFHLVVADVNADGHMDILSTPRPTISDISLLLGRGDGTFESAQPILGVPAPVGAQFSQPVAVTPADFDGDGRLDMAAVDYRYWNVHVFLQSSSGSFLHTWALKTASYPSAVAAADLNGDGRPDLVVADESNQGLGRLSVYVQASGGGFAEPGSSFASGAGPHALVLEDLDSDGLPDISVAVRAGISVLLNHRDVDHDGIPDDSDTCIDGDGDGAGDPGVVSNVCNPDNCPVVPNPGQEDLDADGLGNVCDNCPATANLAQVDSNADGSGDACQPTLAFFGSRSSGDTLEILVNATDPQDDPLSGALEIYNVFDQNITLPDSLATRNCYQAYLPGGVAGEGIGFTNGAAGAPFLFDLDTVLRCWNGAPDYSIALGTCDQPSDFDVILSLADLALPAPLCLRRYGEGAGGLDLTIQSFDLSSLVLSVPGLLALETTFDHGLPAQIDITGLVPGRPYRLKMTVTDGSTVPVTAETTFTDQGESRLVFTGLDTPPQASIVSPATVECTDPAGGLVTLDGSGSSDPDSSPGTHDDIVSFEWYEDFANPGQRLVGTGEVLAAMLPLGPHVLTLNVTDKAGQSDTAESVVMVRDTTPPSLTLTPSPATLWPPNHRLVPVQATWLVSDVCDPAAVVVLASATNSEPDDAPGTGDGSTTIDIQDALIGSADATVQLRAERSGDGSGRVYALTYVARDASGNSVSALAIAAVPHDEGTGPEPVLLQVEGDGTPGMAHVYWNTVGGADRYDVIQGDLSQVTQSDGVIHLGPVHVLASGQIGTTYSEDPGGGIPAIGEAFFYLVQYREGQSASGWGTESSPWPAEPSSCDVACPGDPATGSDASTEMHRR